MNDKDKTFESTLIQVNPTPLSDNSYIQEAEELKKAWINQLVVSMEKMQEAINTLNKDFLNNKTMLLQELGKLKDDIRKDMQLLKKEIDDDSDKLENRLQKRIDEVVSKVHNMVDVTGINNSIALAISDLKTEFTREINDYKIEQTKDLSKHKESMQPVRDAITAIRTKITMWGILAGVIGSGAGTFVLFLIKMYFFKAAD